MRFGRNILILSLLIVLLAAGLVTERLLRPAPPLAAGAPLFPVPPETIVSVRWDLPGAEGAAAGTLALRREGERWRMESPYPGATCDPAAVADLLDALQALRVGSRLGLTEGSAFRVTRRLEVRTAEAVYAAGFGGAQPMALAQTLGIADRVSFLGCITEREALRRYYLAADLFLFPSLYDNAPLVVREAAALRTPSVLIAGSTAAAVVRNDENGFLAANDKEDFARRIRRVLHDKPLLERVGVRASETLARSWEDIAAEVSDRYASLVKRYRP